MIISKIGAAIPILLKPGIQPIANVVTATPINEYERLIRGPYFLATIPKIIAPNGLVQIEVTKI